MIAEGEGRAPHVRRPWLRLRCAAGIPQSRPRPCRTLKPPKAHVSHRVVPHSECEAVLRTRRHDRRRRGTGAARAAPEALYDYAALLVSAAPSRAPKAGLAQRGRRSMRGMRPHGRAPTKGREAEGRVRRAARSGARGLVNADRDNHVGPRGRGGTVVLVDAPAR